VDFAQIMLNASRVPVSKEAYVAIAMRELTLAFLLVLHATAISIQEPVLYVLRPNVRLNLKLV
jgi:hypothetical protein